jgi:putative Mg2+ transporter-C (MgtC) family protein
MMGGWLETLIRMTMAVVASGLIGWDRLRSGQPDGLRTHMLVGLGVALMVSIPLGYLPVPEPAPAPDDDR